MRPLALIAGDSLIDLYRRAGNGAGNGGGADEFSGCQALRDVDLGAVGAQNLHLTVLKLLVAVDHPQAIAGSQQATRQNHQVIDQAALDTGIDKGADTQFGVALLPQTVGVRNFSHCVEHPAAFIEYALGAYDVGLPLAQLAADFCKQVYRRLDVKVALGQGR